MASVAEPSGSSGSEIPRATTRPPTLLELCFDQFFRFLIAGISWLSVLILLLILYRLGTESRLVLQEHGLGVLTHSEWSANPPRAFGLYPQIMGTIYSAVLAMILATVLGVSVAIFLTEDFLPETVRYILRNMVELLAAIPSVIYGLWGIAVLIPLLRGPAGWLHENMGWFPLFSSPLNGPGMLPAVLVLAIMLLPTVTALSRDAISAVPSKLRDGAIGLGATRWQAILKVILPTALSGVIGAVILAFGRALGETMALAMLIGNSNQFDWSILAPSNTLAALLANKFGEAVVDPPQRSALMFAALVLLVITLLVNMLGALVTWHSSRHLKGLQ